MKKLLKTIGGIMIMFIIVLVISAFSTPQQDISDLSFSTPSTSASFYAVQTPTTNLYRGISSTAITARLRTFNDIGGDKLTMSMFGDIGYVTFEPGITGREEGASFTGITDNGDGTQTLTGLTRGLYGRYPFGSGGTARSHGSNTYVVISNSGEFYNHFAIKENAESITGVWTYTSTAQPVYDTAPTFTDSLSLITKGYADNLTNQGAATATADVAGISEEATAAEIAAGTAFGVTEPHYISSEYATTTPNASTTTAIPVTILGKIAQAFWDLTQSFAFTSNVSVGGTFNVTGTSTLATTTITGLKVSGTEIYPTFGGDGSDGALSLASGTTTLDIGNESVFIKNYSSISITATGSLAFSNSETSGTLIILKSQGDCTITSSVLAIDASGHGGKGGIGDAGAVNAGNDGILIQDDATHTSGTVLSNLFRYTTATSTYNLNRNIIVAAGSGGYSGEAGKNSGGNYITIGGDGGDGGGALILECNGAINFTGSISVSGTNGSIGADAIGSGGGGGGGGGASGMFVGVGKSLTSISGTIASTGGIGGSGAATTGGGGGASSAGAGGVGAGAYGGTGGSGGAGKALDYGGAGGGGGAGNGGAGSNGTAADDDADGEAGGAAGATLNTVWMFANYHIN